MKVGIVFGTRPEAIKVAPVYHELKNNNIDVKAVVTGQHKEMLYQVLNLFEIKPDRTPISMLTLLHATHANYSLITCYILSDQEENVKKNSQSIVKKQPLC